MIWNQDCEERENDQIAEISLASTQPSSFSQLNFSSVWASPGAHTAFISGPHLRSQHWQLDLLSLLQQKVSMLLLLLSTYLQQVISHQVSWNAPIILMTVWQLEWTLLIPTKTAAPLSSGFPSHYVPQTFPAFSSLLHFVHFKLPGKHFW